MRENLRKGRREREGGRCREKRKEYKELCERKKKEVNKKWERKTAEAKRKSEAWMIVNRERKRRGKRVHTAIEMREWKSILGLLGGVEERVINTKGRSRREIGGGVEEDISREKIKAVIRRMKDGEAAEMDEISNVEVWKGEEIGMGIL